MKSTTLEMARRVAPELATVHGARVGLELMKLLKEAHPARGLRLLQKVGALEVVLPEIATLVGVPQPEAHHPEVDTFEHVCLALEVASRLSSDVLVRFGVLVHDLGKGVTPAHLLPQHLKHEEAGVPLVRALCKRLHLPREFETFGVQAAEFHTHLHRFDELRAGSVVTLFKTLRAMQHPEVLTRLCLVSEADARGRLGREGDAYPQAAKAQACLTALKAVDVTAVVARAKSPTHVPEMVMQALVEAVKKAKA